MVERKVDWEYLVLAFLATAVIMSSIFYFGVILNDTKVESLKNEVKQIEVEQRAQSQGLKLAESAHGNECSAIRSWVNSKTPQLRDLRKDVAAYESSSKLRGEDYKTIKERYMNLLIQNLIEVRTLESKCGDEKVEIIYLYSKNDCHRCQDQGTVLTDIKQDYNKQVMVYPLDTDLKLKNIQLIRNIYDVKEYPAIIMEGKVYRGFQSKETLETEINPILASELNKTQNLSSVN